MAENKHESAPHDEACRSHDGFACDCQRNSAQARAQEPLRAEKHKARGQDFLVENLRGMCAFTEPYGRCDQCRELRNFCTPCYAAVEIERLRAAVLFTESEIVEVLTSLYQDGAVDLVLADRIAALMNMSPFSSSPNGTQA